MRVGVEGVGSSGGGLVRRVLVSARRVRSWGVGRSVLLDTSLVDGCRLMERWRSLGME